MILLLLLIVLQYISVSQSEFIKEECLVDNLDIILSKNIN